MKTRKSVLLFSSCLLFGILALYSCKKEESHTTFGQLITNGNVESGTVTPDIWYHSPDQQDFNLSWTDQEFFSPSKSLSISNSISHSSDFAYWAQSFSNKIPYGLTVMVKLRVKCNLTGDGVAIAIRGDDTDQPAGTSEQFSTSQNFFPISGNSYGWIEKYWMLHDINTTIKSLTVYLVYLPNTTGEVYFDNVEISVLY